MDPETLKKLIYLKEDLGEYDEKIKEIAVEYGPTRAGDIPHSLASIAKAKQNLGYEPKYSLREGLKIAVEWYWKNL